MLDKEITIYDIARRLKISSATVSRAFSETAYVKKSTQEKIFQLADQLGYRRNHFAQSLRRLRTNTIGIIVPKIDGRFATVLSAMEEVASNEGYNLVISQSLDAFEKEASVVKKMFNLRVDGLIICLSAATKDLTHINPFINKNVPVLLLDSELHGIATAGVSVDISLAAAKATEHLIETGCKRVAHVTSISCTRFYKQLRDGYKASLKKYQLPLNEKLVFLSDLSPASGADIADQLASLDLLPDGVFFANDAAAFTCMMHLKKRGIRIPQDVALTAFSTNSCSSFMQPSLTTIRYPARVVGEVAIKKLIDHLTDDAAFDASSSMSIKAELIVRESSNKDYKF